MANIDIINTEIEELEQKPLNYTVAEKLAIMYYLREQYTPVTKTETTPVRQSSFVRFEGESEFAYAINNKPINDVLKLMEELMSVVQITNERLYDCVMRKLTVI